MKKSKLYLNVSFSADHIREASEAFEAQLSEKQKEKLNTNMSCTRYDETWSYESETELSEAEFFSEYRQGIESATYEKTDFSEEGAPLLRVCVSGTSQTRVTATLPKSRQIQSVFEVFEKHLQEATLPPEPPPAPPTPTIFSGHGGSPQWRDLKDHLQDQHGYEVTAYEIGARAGHAVRDNLDRMLEQSSFAILVMTAEDKDPDGNFHARPNVMHELGLFQGHLGFNRAIVLLEESTQEFSNIHGIHQVRYDKNRIRETFGDVLAVIGREFGGNAP